MTAISDKNIVRNNPSVIKCLILQFTDSLKDKTYHSDFAISLIYRIREIREGFI